MADDFQVKITADLDTSEAEQKLNNLINDKINSNRCRIKSKFSKEIKF